MIRLVVPLICGIIIFTQVQYTFTPLHIGIIGLSLIIIAIIDNTYIQSYYSLRWVFGVNLTVLIIFAGYILAQKNVELHNPRHFSHFSYTNENDLLRVRLITSVSEKTNSLQITGKVTQIVSSTGSIDCKGKLLIYLPKDSLAYQLKYGDVIYLKSEYQEVICTQNPGTFDFRRFLEFQNIFHVAFLRTGQWHVAGVNEGMPLFRISHAMREKALEIFRNNNISGKEYSVVSALLVGYREYLDEDLQREFAGAGAMHILCVSGLHVGIIFLALNLIFSFLNPLKNGMVLKTIIIILLIWLYASITGFSPSVLRASTMFSFLAMGQRFRRSISIYNSLAASAMVLVLVDPFIITRIGFQLSYLAVLGIVSLQPFLYRKIYFKNKILRYAWGLTTVSIAAQLATGPLAIFYFNQFPNYFILTNLIVIPLAAIIINAGLIFFLLSPIPMISTWAGTFLSWVVYSLHTSVSFIDSLPYSSSQNLYVNLLETCLIIVGLTMLIVFAHHAYKKAFFTFLAIMLITFTSLGFRYLKNQYTDKLIIYQVPTATAIDFISGKKCYFWGCDKMQQNPKLIECNLKAHRIMTGAAKHEPLHIFASNQEFSFVHNNLKTQGSWLQFKNVSIKIVNENTPVFPIPTISDTVDLLIINKDVRQRLKDIIRCYPAKEIIIDSSNSFWRADRLLAQCDSLNLPCWSVMHQGAYQRKVK